MELHENTSRRLPTFRTRDRASLDRVARAGAASARVWSARATSTELAEPRDPASTVGLSHRSRANLAKNEHAREGGEVMQTGRRCLLLTALVVCACVQPVLVTPEPEQDRGPSTAATLGIPPGHLPRPGECRIWIPGAPPGQQPRPRSRPCDGIVVDAPAGSWVVYRPSRNRKYVHVRVIDEQRAGVIVRIRIFAIETGALVREKEGDQGADEP